MTYDEKCMHRHLVTHNVKALTRGDLDIPRSPHEAHVTIRGEVGRVLNENIGATVENFLLRSVKVDGFYITNVSLYPLVSGLSPVMWLARGNVKVISVVLEEVKYHIEIFCGRSKLEHLGCNLSDIEVSPDAYQLIIYALISANEIP